jgi:hypothetical protein
MGNKHLKTSLIPKNAANTIQEFRYINKNPALMEGWAVEGDNAQVFVSIRFVQFDFQCFSDWQKVEMKAFWDFIDKVHSKTWSQIYATGGKKEKTGLAYTPLPIERFPDGSFKNQLDPQINLFELRIDQQKRVHGFRYKSVFYICWLDKNHEICA